MPGEVFLVEILRNEGGWSGHLRFGLTTIDPNDANLEIPQYALPDMANMGASWIFAVPNNFDFDTRANGRVGRQGAPSSSVVSQRYRPDNSSQTTPQTRGPPQNTIQSINGLNTHVLSSFNEEVPTNESLEELGESEVEFYADDDTRNINQNSTSWAASCLAKLQLKSKLKPNTLPTDVGAQLGVTYVVNAAGSGEMHFIFNGVDQGIYASDIPIEDDKPIYAVADVYGTTKTLRVLQIGAMNSLKNACKETILNQVERDNVQKLPLPGKLKNYLLGTN